MSPLPKRLQQSLQQSKSLEAEDDGDDDYDQNTDWHVGYRLPRVFGKHKQTDDEDVSDYVSSRLKIARENALAKYREVWG